MLNITHTSVSKYVNKADFKSYKNLASRSNSKALLKMLIFLLVISFGGMFLPWTQNIRSKGYVTTLNPFDKPQNIQPLIGGRIAAWEVKEGDLVSIGDTIALLTEAKEAYLDPDLLANTKQQQSAKEKSAEAYLLKSKLLREQLFSLRNNRDSKLDQLKIKQEQLDLKITTTKLDLEAALTYVKNASNQLDRMEIMYDKGIKSLTDLEEKRLSKREAIAKQNSLENKIIQYKNDKQNLLQEIKVVNTDYLQKVAKIESEIQSADSYRFSLLGETNKIQSKVNQITQRQDAFVIRSPINGRITKVLKNGIGEYVKAQESIVTIVPTAFQKAVELYIKPFDMPLIKEGKKVRLQFDGWPAIVFSGWPENSFGTFAGKVFAIDNDISENGKYRILVIEDDTEKSWPELIRIGSGAQGLLLLNDVKVYYELWRQLNGFPPDFYNPENNKLIKKKAPIRKIK